MTHTGLEGSFQFAKLDERNLGDLTRAKTVAQQYHSTLLKESTKARLWFYLNLSLTFGACVSSVEVVASNDYYIT